MSVYNYWANGFKFVSNIERLNRFLNDDCTKCSFINQKRNCDRCPVSRAYERRLAELTEAVDERKVD